MNKQLVIRKIDGRWRFCCGIRTVTLKNGTRVTLEIPHASGSPCAVVAEVVGDDHDGMDTMLSIGGCTYTLYQAVVGLCVRNDDVHNVHGHAQAA